MLLLILFAVHVLAGDPCPTAATVDLFPVLEIQNSILTSSGSGPSLLEPAWLVIPTTATLCSYPGIECDSSCRVTEINMRKWHRDPEKTAVWIVRAGTTTRGPLSFHAMNRMITLFLTIPDGSSGNLPGTIRDPTCSANKDLPGGIVNYAIFGKSTVNPIEENQSFTSTVTEGTAFFQNTLGVNTCYGALFRFQLDGFTKFRGQYLLDDCINTNIVSLIDVPGINGISVCANSDTFLFFDNAGLQNFNDVAFCQGSGIIQSVVVINNPQFFNIPYCIIQNCVGYIDWVNGGGEISGLYPGAPESVTWIFAQNEVCRIEQNINFDTLLPPQSIVGTFLDSPSYGYSDQRGTEVLCYVERDRRDCVNCISGEELFVVSPIPIDQCGVCNGNNSCLDCHGEPHGTLTYDVCDICGGGGNSCNDCAGVPNGSNVYDICDVCNGNGEACRDCAGVPFGTFQYDSCNVCNGGDVCRIDCLGVPYGTSQRDMCGVCNGDNECVDCDGVPYGTLILDICGVCGGNNACAPCDPGEQDVCGVCFGDGTSCVDCLGVVFGTTQYDACDVCAGDNTLCVDCAGVPNGSLVRDVCDVCDGDGTSCIGCDGEVDGPDLDLCGVCGGTNTCLDCEGVPNGLASYDECDVCDGDNSSCTDCRGVVNGGYAVNACSKCVPASSIDPNVIECDPVETASGLSTTMWIMFGVTSGVVLLVLVCCCCWWAPCVRRRRLRRRSTTTPTPVRSRGNLNPVMTSMLLVTLLASGVGASVTHPATVLYKELCETTNIASVLPGSCPVNSMAVSACDADASGFRSSSGQALFICYSNFLIADTVRHAYLDLVPGLRGTISERAWQTLRVAETIRVAGSIANELSPPPVDNEDLLPQLSIEQLDDDDHAFENFAQLKTLVLRNIRTHGPVRLWSSLGRDAARLEHLELTNIVTLTGRFDHNNVLCSFPFLKKLIITGTELSGNPRCDRYQHAWFNLEEINLRGNRLIGRVPNFFPLPFLKSISMDSNTMSGAAPLPNELPPKIEKLTLANNRFSGSLPGLWSSLTRLEVFSLDHNVLSGPVPVLDVFGLKEFSVSFNRLSGLLSSDYATLQADSYDRFAVNDNLLLEPFPSFSANQFTGPCSFEHNAVCRARPPYPYSPFDVPYAELDIARCTYSFDDTNLCPSGICGDRTCLGCDGIANSNLTIDACGLCGGNGNACRDCLGVQHGTALYDICGVCNGNGDSCDDCAGVPAGTHRYDACGVCGGDSSSCADCLGIPRGPTRIDACGVCNGRNLTCSDCLGVLNGTSIRDELGVCNGNGRPVSVGFGNQLSADLASLSTGGVWFFFILMIALLFASVILCACAARWAFRSFKGKK